MATEKAATAVSEFLSFEQFMEEDPVEYDVVRLPKGACRIGSVTGQEWAEWTEMRESPEGRKKSGGWLIAISLVDGNGRRIGDPTKAAEIVKKNLKTSELILRAIFALNGISKDTKAEAVAKNG